MRTKSKKLTSQELIDKITFLLGDEDLDMNEHDNLFLVLFERFKYASQSKWIDVKERLPEMGERVLVMHNGVGIQIAWLKFGGYYETSSTSFEPEHVQYWQPLPEIPTI